jgi:hypothetical protein
MLFINALSGIGLNGYNTKKAEKTITVSGTWANKDHEVKQN